MASLVAKTGVLGHRLAAHLLRRTTFHPTKEMIDAYATKTTTQAMTDLMTMPALNVEIPIEPNTGLPWMDPTNFYQRYVSPHPNTPTSSNGNLRKFMRAWWIDEARLDQTIWHKMEFFLHSVFVVTPSEGSVEEYFDYLRLLRHYAVGNYKILARKMTMDNQMLRYLDNNVNTNSSPNENYAREFLELFTIGKGPQIGDGDYTNYQELDIAVGAELLTGFKNGNRTVYTDPDTNLPTGYPSFNKHVTTDKTFSSAFQNLTITGAVDALDMFRELDEYVDMIFAQDATAITICRRLYRYFVSKEINAEIETDIIEPLAVTLRTNNYELQPVLVLLLSSQHFYNEDGYGAKVIGGLMKSPLEQVTHALNFFNVNIPNPVTDSYNHYFRFYKRCFIDTFGAKGGMDILSPTNVAGYPAYYQEPAFNRAWFTSSSIVSRYKLAEQLLTGRRVLLGGDLGTVQLAIVPFFANSGYFSNPGNALTLVTELTTYLFCEVPDTDRLQYFVGQLIGDFDEAYWAYLWSTYIGSGLDDEVKNPLESLFSAVMYSPEFQLM